MVDLIEGGFDLAIRVGHLPTSNLLRNALSIPIFAVAVNRLFTITARSYPEGQPDGQQQ
ncbi:hypothetical protein [Vibrio mimicus]|uniref:hypothetical protein n=1 Tax=Vibrio mimicus TaxID=674 RepID=UPI003A95D35A